MMQSRSTLFTNPGGDTIQMLKTAEALRERGCTVSISTELEPDLASYDIVHLFNLTRPQEVYPQARNARRQGRRIVLSPIYVSYREYEQCARSGLLSLVTRHLEPQRIEYLKIMARAVRNLEINRGTLQLMLKGFSSLQRRIIGMSSVMLPNSESEMRRVLSEVKGVRSKNYVVVPNAVDRNVFSATNDDLKGGVGRCRDSVLCVARIDGVKNQLNLVRAMKGLPWQLLLIGKPANHRAYFRQIQKEAGANVKLLGGIDHDSLADYYRTARVHVLASWMETTGLSSLEAGVMGCNLVITDKGDTRDYFGDYAFYCEPDSVESIRAAIVKAYDSPFDPGLKRHIHDNCTWDKAAEKTLEGYRMALNTGASP
jgi:glycosyltransferase involved in cell wall biosynthesis